MTDRAWITSGAERSAPRSHSGASTPDTQGVANAGAYLVPSHGAQLATLILESNPPHSRLQLQRRALPRGRPHGQRRAPQLRSVFARGAIERDAKTRRALGRATDRRHTAPKSCTKGGGASTQPLACLTSASRGRHPPHVGIELSSVRRRPAVGSSGHGSRLTVERGALLLKGGIQ